MRIKTLPSVSRAKRYRGFAEDARHEANKTTSTNVLRTLIMIAELWDRLADGTNEVNTDET